LFLIIFIFRLAKAFFSVFANASWRNKILGEIQDLSYKKHKLYQ